ncbi:MAG: IS630 family transposase [bacterium]|nr:IS630 family transposase [bacterium]
MQSRCGSQCESACIEFQAGLETGGLRLQKKRRRPAEQDRPDVAKKRRAFFRWMRTVDARKLVFVDESGANLSIGRSHAWIQRGQELADPRPVNWGKNLTMIGAIRRDGWLTMGTIWKAANTERFTAWVRKYLAPRLRRGDIVIMDNLRAHKGAEVQRLVESRGASIKFLPPYSPDLNPIESAWALGKKRLKKIAPRTPRALRLASHRARRVVKPQHCRAWVTYAGYRPLK